MRKSARNVAVLVLGIIFIVLLASLPALAGCDFSISPTNSQVDALVGAYGSFAENNITASNPGIEGNIWTYNPVVQYGQSAAWFMMHDNTKPSVQSYAQAGWVKTKYTNNQEWIFAEIADTNSNYWTYYLTPTAACLGAQGSNGSGTPTSNCTGTSPTVALPQYMVHYNGSGTFFFEYQNRVFFQNTNNLGWGPGNEFEAMGEEGYVWDQSPGDSTTKVGLLSVQVDNNGWNTANLLHPVDSQGYQSAQWYDSANTWIWDSRCK